MWRHFEAGFSAGLSLPVGTVRLRPVGGTTANVSGVGDLGVRAAYSFQAPINDPWRPRIRIQAALALPTGTSRRVDDAGAEVPPNLIAIGSGAIGAGFDATIAQPVSAKVSLRGWLGARAPLTFSEADNRFGWSATAGLGAMVQPSSKFLLTGGLSGLHRAKTRNRINGDLTNSGGDSLSVDLGVTFLASDDIAVGISGQLPLYQNVNGVQVAQSVALMSFVGLSFGTDDDDDEDEHDHGDEHDHSDDKHGDHGDHGDDKHGDHGDDKHGDHGDDKPATHTPDISSLATGGSSFSLASAAVPGKIVAIDFWADWCKPCKGIDAALSRHAARDPKFALRKVEVPNPRTSVAIEHLDGKPKLPTVWLLDANGAVVEKLEGVTEAELWKALSRVRAAQ